MPRFWITANTSFQGVCSIVQNKSGQLLQLALFDAHGGLGGQSIILRMRSRDITSCEGRNVWVIRRKARLSRRNNWLEENDGFQTRIYSRSSEKGSGSKFYALRRSVNREVNLSVDCC